MATLAAEIALPLLEDFPELAEALNPPEWHDHAACRGVNPATFFPERGQTARTAKEICSRCPVAADCYADALEHDDGGIRAGTSERERRRRLAA